MITFKELLFMVAVIAGLVIMSSISMVKEAEEKTMKAMYNADIVKVLLADTSVSKDDRVYNAKVFMNNIEYENLKRKERMELKK